MKKAILFAALLLVTLSSFAQSNSTPVSSRNRQKISCFGSYLDDATASCHDYKVNLLIDWNVDVGNAYISVLRRMGHKYRLSQQLKMQIELVQNPYTEVLQSVAPTPENSLTITWRSDLDDVPVHHELVANGKTYPIRFCVAE